MAVRGNVAVAPPTSAAYADTPASGGPPTCRVPRMSLTHRPPEQRRTGPYSSSSTPIADTKLSSTKPPATTTATTIG